MIELYGMSSPNVRKVGVMLEELGLDYVLHHVAVMKGDQFAPEFRALSPLSKVPVLVDHERGAGQPIIESGAILIYLAEAYGAFLPVAGPARYEVLQWLMVQMASIGPMFGQHNHFRILGTKADPYAAARYRTQSERLYRCLEDRLATREWIAGDMYSIADMAVYPWALYLEQHGFDPAAHPAFIRWRDTIGRREAVKQSWSRFAADFNQLSEESRRTANAQTLDQFFWRDPGSPPADYSSILR